MISDDPKYIVFDGSGIDMPEFPIIFPNYFKHDQIAQRFQGCKPLGAGFVKCSTGECYGNSLNLNLSARPEDTEVIQAQFNYKK